LIILAEWNLKMKLFNSKILTISLLISSLVFTGSVSANPTELDLSFTYSSRGVLAVDVKFDQEATTRCIARHRVSLYHEDKVAGDAGVIRQSAFNRSVPVGRKSTSLRARRLLGAKKAAGKDPIMAIQTRLICGDEQVDSNIEARFIRCGERTARLSLSKFLKDLRQKLE
jgi:hypothetical protein